MRLRLFRMTSRAAAITLAVSLAAPALGQGLPELMQDEEAATPGPTSSQAGPEAEQGTGIAITRSLRPGDVEDGPFVGPGSQERVPVDQALEMLREAQARVGALEDEVRQETPHGDLTATPLGNEAQQILIEAQHAVQAFQHSGAVPTDSQEVRDTLLTITEAQNALLQQPGEAVGHLATLQDQMGSLSATAEQSADAPRPAE